MLATALFCRMKRLWKLLYLHAGLQGLQECPKVLELLHRLVWDTLGSLAAVDTFFFYCAEAYAAWAQKLTQARINRQNELRCRRLCGWVLDAEQSA